MVSGFWRNILKTSSKGPKVMSEGGASLGRPQNLNLIIILKIGFYGKFPVFPNAKCKSEPEKFYFDPILVRNVSIKIGP